MIKNYLLSPPHAQHKLAPLDVRHPKVSIELEIILNFLTKDEHKVEHRYFHALAKFATRTIKGVGRKFSRGEGATEKRPKISKKYRKIALFSIFRGGQRKKRPKNSKIRPKNSTFKPLSTIFVPCLKIQKAMAPPLPTPMRTTLFHVHDIEKKLSSSPISRASSWLKYIVYNFKFANKKKLLYVHRRRRSDAFAFGDARF